MDVVMSRDRIRNDARQAVAKNRKADTCPPEFAPYRHLWLAEYWTAIEDAAVKSQRLPAQLAMSVLDQLQAG